MNETCDPKAKKESDAKFKGYAQEFETYFQNLLGKKPKEVRMEDWPKLARALEACAVADRNELASLGHRTRNIMAAVRGSAPDEINVEHVVQAVNEFGSKLLERERYIEELKEEHHRFVVNELAKLIGIVDASRSIAASANEMVTREVKEMWREKRELVQDIALRDEQLAYLNNVVGNQKESFKQVIDTLLEREQSLLEIYGEPIVYTLKALT